MAELFAPVRVKSPQEIAAERRAFEMDELAAAQQKQDWADRNAYRAAMLGGDLQTAAKYDPKAQQRIDDQRGNAFRGIATRAWGIYTSPAPKQAAAQMGILEAFAQEAGKAPDALTDDEVRAMSRNDAYKAIAQGGLDLAAFKDPKQPGESGAMYKTRGPDGSPWFAGADGTPRFPAYQEPASPREPARPTAMDVTLPDGRVQRQWVMPGQSSGTPIGAPGSPPRSGNADPAAMRKEFRSLATVKGYESVLPRLESIRRAPNTPAGDLDFIYAVGNLLDPGSVVREGEMALVAKAGSLVSQILGSTNVNLAGGSRLDANRRAQLQEMLDNRVSQYQAQYDQDRAVFEDYARSRGLDPYQVVGRHPKDAFGPPPAPASGSVPSFATEAEAEAAARAKRIKPGDRVVVGGVSGTWQ